MSETIKKDLAAAIFLSTLLTFLWLKQFPSIKSSSEKTI